MVSVKVCVYGWRCTELWVQTQENLQRLQQRKCGGEMDNRAFCDVYLLGLVCVSCTLSQSTDDVFIHITARLVCGIED
jgi:hypothetical protein